MLRFILVNITFMTFIWLIIILFTIILLLECWNKEPYKRPDMKHVVERLKASMSNTENEHSVGHSSLLSLNKSSLHEALSKFSGFNNMDPSKLIECFNEEKVNEIVTRILEETNEGKGSKLILGYINSSQDIKEVYDWSLNNQNNSNCIFLLGYL